MSKRNLPLSATLSSRRVVALSDNSDFLRLGEHSVAMQHKYVLELMVVAIMLLMVLCGASGINAVATPISADCCLNATVECINANASTGSRLDNICNIVDAAKGNENNASGSIKAAITDSRSDNTTVSTIKSGGTELAILMYHNIIPDYMSPNKYEIKLSELEQDFKFIRSHGYTTVLPSQIIAYVRGGKLTLPDKAVMVTFDDGFHNYNKYLEPLLEKYDINCVISVVCGFSKFNKNTSATGRYIYMDYDDIAAIASNSRVEISGHSNDLHWQRNGRLGANKKRGESDGQYRSIFNKDCVDMENNLAKIGVKLSCYTYPYGAFCASSEEILKERGYAMSLICEEKINIITQDKDCLYRLGRYNRSGTTGSAQMILNKAFKVA